MSSSAAAYGAVKAVSQALYGTLGAQQVAA